MLMEHTTLKEIAQKARVSPATVSRILGKKYRRKSKTVETVERIIEEMRYAKMQQSTVDQEISKCIGIVMHSYRDFLNTHYNSTLVSAIAETLTAENFTTHLIVINSRRMSLSYVKSQVLAHKICGLLILEFDNVYAISKKLESLPMPVIGVGVSDFLERTVFSDGYQAGCDAANYLWSNGHRQFALVTMALSDLTQNQRLMGFKDTVKALGGAPESIWVREFRSTNDSVAGWIAELVNRRQYFDAVFCFDSIICRKIYAAMSQSGINVPDNISLISFEEDGELEHLPTPLTVLAQPTRQMGEIAVDMLIKRLNNIESEAKEILHCALIVRGSVNLKKQQGNILSNNMIKGA